MKINTKRQAFYTIFIVIGAALLLYDLAFENEEVYIKVIGLVVLMFGLYSSTRQWASDNNKEETNNEVKITEEIDGEPDAEESEKPEGTTDKKS